ncbi:hypothetical protein [Nitrosomonas communis]|uniref:Uncharacterized protein n=1 Tax=Nitrosomonas communis TaxID=44574 RepID=A0A1I4X6D2_9PROT|nr:hypothetical protein [Nitrosomonas communis]SFN21265.1 hypothetical protein SAMN05421863_11372 [Nitrosomonas communis]
MTIGLSHIIRLNIGDSFREIDWLVLADSAISSTGLKAVIRCASVTNYERPLIPETTRVTDPECWQFQALL